MPGAQDGGLGSLLQFSSPDPWTMIARIWWIATIVLNLALTIGVALHGKGKPTSLVPRWIWMFATLVNGPLGALAYWVVNVARPGEASKR